MLSKSEKQNGVLKGNNDSNLKLVIRLLPVGLTEDDFETQLHTHINLADNNSVIDHYYVKGRFLNKPFEHPVYSRAYFMFKNKDKMDAFVQDISGASFFDKSTGDRMIPSLDSAVYNKMDLPRKKMSHNGGSIEHDAVYKHYVALLAEGKEDTFDIMQFMETAKKKNKKRNTKRKKRSKTKEIKSESAKDSNASFKSKPGEENLLTDPPKGLETVSKKKRSRKKSRANKTSTLEGGEKDVAKSLSENGSSKPSGRRKRSRKKKTNVEQQRATEEHNEKNENKSNREADTKEKKASNKKRVRRRKPKKPQEEKETSENK